MIIEKPFPKKKDERRRMKEGILIREGHWDEWNQTNKKNNPGIFCFEVTGLESL